ncbi:uncharacterized protein LOC135475254 [Liolophura sinensis]|uniref:uncharacterized protein LOC135475254 n=1 Tax=Liolophura sinensis TaxID=3198878 RepID=UPI00315930FB
MGDPIDCGYQLRRIGPPKSLEDVQDIMRLSYGCARFGRSYLNGGPNEFFLDSSKMKNFISRRHAEIYVKADGECVLVDLGLNGTFVNDIRVDGKCSLHLDDRVTFGHIRGMSIKPGSFAPEPNSEFQFIFERSKPCSKSVKSVDIGEEDSLCKIELKFEHPDKCDDIPGRSECIVNDKFASRRDSYDKQVPFCEPGNQTASPTVLLRTPVEDSSVENIPVQLASSASKDDSVIVLDISDDSDSDKDDRPHSQSLAPIERNDSGHPSCGSDTDQQAYVVLTSSCDLAIADPPISAQDSNLLSGSTSVINQERSSSPIIPDMSNGSQTPILYGKQVIAGCKIQLTFPGAASPEHLQGCSTSPRLPGDAGFVSCSASEDGDDDSVDGNLSLNMASVSQKPHKRNCQRRGRRKKRFKKSTDNEDEVQLYEVATCASLDCQKPNSSKIGWVQCDSCDQWYHTTCVGCTYKQVRDKDIEFHCGCV